MRRKDREKDEAFALEVLRDCEYATLATVNAENRPYCVPISLVVVDSIIYIHSAKTGLKLDNIAHNNNVCVSGVRHTKLLPEEYTTEFESAVALGTCTLVEGEDEKTMALRMLCEKYASSNMAAFDDVIARSLGRTAVGKIAIAQITGKAKTPPQ